MTPPLDLPALRRLLAEERDKLPFDGAWAARPTAGSVALWEVVGTPEDYEWPVCHGCTEREAKLVAALFNNADALLAATEAGREAERDKELIRAACGAVERDLWATEKARKAAEAKLAEVEADRDAQRAELERTARREQNLQWLVTYMRTEAARVTGVPHDAPADVVETVRQLYDMAESGKEAEAKLAAAEAREAGLREVLIHVSETIGGSRLAQLTRMRDVIDAALKEPPSRQDTDAPTAYDLSAHADIRRRKP